MAVAATATQLFDDYSSPTDLPEAGVIDPGNLTSLQYNTVIAGIVFGIID